MNNKLVIDTNGNIVINANNFTVFPPSSAWLASTNFSQCTNFWTV